MYGRREGVSLDDCDLFSIVHQLALEGIFVRPSACPLYYVSSDHLIEVHIDWVPLPVCQTTKRNWSSSLPSDLIANLPNEFLGLGSSTFQFCIGNGGCFFKMAKARMISTGILWPPIVKVVRRTLCPGSQYLSEGTLTIPMVSFLSCILL